MPAALTTARPRRPRRPQPVTPLPGYKPKPRLPFGLASANAWALENAAPPTLPPTLYREISDADLGLPHDPIAQERAERFLRAAIAHRLRVEQKAADTARKPAVHVEVDDDALHLAHVTDHAIYRELVRLTSNPARSQKANGAAA